jgi:beta-galactosidase
MLDFGWKFHLGDITDPTVTQLNYNDNAWRVLNIPHDFVVEGTFSQSANKDHGYLPYGIGWYRRHFTIPTSAKGQTIWVDFDGTYRNANAYLNGFKLGNHPSGYTSYRYYISNVTTLNYGSDNVLVVRCDATKPEGWWYDGGGIYRHVWLNIASPLHVEPWGVYAPSTVTSAVTYDKLGRPQASATIDVQTNIKNDLAQTASGTLTTTILDSQGGTVAKSAVPISVNANSNANFTQSFKLSGVYLWSLEFPTLYTVSTSVAGTSGNPDEISTTIGVRKINWDVNNGFFLNDKAVKIKGMANHQDFAGVGVAVPDSLQVFRVSKLKEMGANAWRTAHNPPTPALLDTTDRLGFLVWDENHLLDDSAPYEADLRSMLLRDRNHPSIIMWSLCNEALCNGEGTDKARQVGTVLKSIVREYDTRLVTAAMNGGWGSGLSYVIDIQGFNYNTGQYDSYHKSHPTQPLIGSETASTVSDRGIYANNPNAGYVSAYDVNYPGWGASAEGAWQPIVQRNFMSGCFVWTGFDYKGEPTPYGWPNINSHFGVIDIAGFPKDNFWYYQVNWRNESNQLHIFPHWNWQAGQSVDVWAYSNTNSVELFINGKSQGKQKITTDSHVAWKVTFESGTLEGRGYDASGKQVVSQTIQTTGNPAAIALSLDLGQNGLRADGQDVALVAVSIVDSKGTIVPTAGNEVSFTVTGPGSLIGLGSGDPSNHEPDKGTQRHAFNGLVRAIVQAGQQAGTIVLEATSPGLTSAKLEITSK